MRDSARYFPLCPRDASSRQPGAVTRTLQPAGGAFRGEEIGKRLETAGSPALSSGTVPAQARRPFPAPACGSRDRTSRGERPPSPSDVLRPLGRGCEARTGCTRSGRSLTSLALPLGLPQARPGPRPPRLPGSPEPSPRDSQRLPTTQHPGRQPGLGGRSCHPHHPVTGLRSVTTAAAALFLRLLGGPPTSLATNGKEGPPEIAVRWPA